MASSVRLLEVLTSVMSTSGVRRTFDLYRRRNKFLNCDKSRMCFATDPARQTVYLPMQQPSGFCLIGRFTAWYSNAWYLTSSKLANQNRHRLIGYLHMDNPSDVLAASRVEAEGGRLCLQNWRRPSPPPQPLPPRRLRYGGRRCPIACRAPPHRAVLTKRQAPPGAGGISNASSSVGSIATSCRCGAARSIS